MLGRLFGKKETKKSEKFILMLLLGSVETLNISAVQQAMSELFPTVACELEPDVNPLFGKVNGIQVMAAPMGVPIPTNEVHECAQMCWQWKVSPGSTDHADHMIAMAVSDAPIAEQMLACTQLAIAISQAHSVVAWYYGDAGIVVSPEFARSAFDNPISKFPSQLWVAVITSTDGPGIYSLSTIGMNKLGHREFEVVRTRSNEWLLRLYDFVNYVLEQGPVLKHGNTVGADAHEKIRVEVGKSKLGKPGEVIRFVSD
ncbi:MAG: DUF4261 domain-containing protein [Fimbriimonadaceae bacterium]